MSKLKITKNFGASFFILMVAVIPNYIFSQNTIWHTLPQYDANKINVRIITDKALKGFKPQSQYIGVEVTNKTNDILFVRVEYWAVTGCGSNVKGELGATESGERLNPGQSAKPDFWSNMHSFNVVDRMPSSCSDKEGLRRKVGDEQYSWITDIGYRIISIENLSEKERQEKADKKKKDLDKYIEQGDMYLKNKSYDAAIKNYESALALDSSNATAKQKLQNAKSEKAKYLSEESKPKQQQQQNKKESSKSSTNTSSSDDFWNDTSTSQTSQKTNKQIEADRNLQEAKDRYAEQENRFLNHMANQKEEQQRKDAIVANSYYANEARSRAEQGIYDNSSFNRTFDNVDDLQSAFYQQVNAINQNAQDLGDARSQQNANNLEYYWGNSTGTDRAVGEVATGIANIIGQAKAEKERKEAQEKLKKERDEQIARIENERKQKIMNLRNDLFKQFPEGGVPLSRHNVNLDELYFFTYSYDGKTLAKVSNVFPYAKFKDGTWAFKDKVTAESEKAAGSKVTLVGYYTTKELAEKERNAFVGLLPQAEVKVTAFEVKGRKQEGTSNTSADFWGNDTKTETKATQKKTDDFWEEAPTKTDKKTDTKKKDDFWD